MESGKKTMGPVGLGILSSLSESYTLLPFTVYSSLISGQGGSVNFFIPVVILYSIERACLIALRGFGEIANPYRILRNGLVIALIGSLLMVLSAFYRPLLAVSALFVGIGLSPMRAMFIPLSSRLIEENQGLKKGKAIGTLLYFATMIAALVLGKLSIPVVPVLFLLYIAASAAIAFRLDGDALYGGRKCFDSSRRSYAFFVFGLLALLSLLILRQYQQSGVSVLMWLTPMAVILFASIEIYRRRDYRDFSYQTYWVGGIKSFAMLYSLVYHTSVGNASMAMLVYLAIALSSMISGPARKAIARYLKGRALIDSCIILSSLFSFLLIAPFQGVNLAGIFLSCLFANIAASIAGDGYMHDERYVREERALVRIRIQTAGSIIEQLVLFFTIYLLGEIGIHENLLAPYASGSPDQGVGLLLRSSGAICALILLAFAILACFAGRRNIDKGNRSN